VTEYSGFRQQWDLLVIFRQKKKTRKKILPQIFVVTFDFYKFTLWIHKYLSFGLMETSILPIKSDKVGF